MCAGRVKEKMKIHLAAAGFLSLYMLPQNIWRKKKQIFSNNNLTTTSVQMLNCNTYACAKMYVICLPYDAIFWMLFVASIVSKMRKTNRERENGSARSLPFQFQRIIESSFFQIIVIICFDDCLLKHQTKQVSICSQFCLWICFSKTVFEQWCVHVINIHASRRNRYKLIQQLNSRFNISYFLLINSSFEGVLWPEIKFGI